MLVTAFNYFFLTVLCIVGYITFYDRLVTSIRKLRLRYPRFNRVNVEFLLVVYTIFVIAAEYFFTDHRIGDLDWIMTMNLQLVAFVFCNLMLLHWVNNLAIQLVFLVLMGMTGELSPMTWGLLIVGCGMLNLHHILKFKDNIIHQHRLFYWGVPAGAGLYFWLVAQSMLRLPIVTFITILVFYATACFFSFWLTAAWQQDLITEQHLSSEVLYDGLTNVKNWQAFEGDFNRLFDQMTDREHLTIITLDIDDFKQINDTYGHLTGNKVLIGFAGQLQRLLRYQNAEFELYRTGGEEFTMILPQVDLPAAREVAHQCLDLIRHLEINYDNQFISLTSSLGVTSASLTDHSATDVFQRADHNLYLSKKGGKNRITIEDQTD